MWSPGLGPTYNRRGPGGDLWGRLPRTRKFRSFGGTNQDYTSVPTRDVGFDNLSCESRLSNKDKVPNRGRQGYTGHDWTGVPISTFFPAPGLRGCTRCSWVIWSEQGSSPSTTPLQDQNVFRDEGGRGNGFEGVYWEAVFVETPCGTLTPNRRAPGRRPSDQ